MSVFPLDIWRHLISFEDQELLYRISCLSKQLYHLAQPYRESKPITARPLYHGGIDYVNDTPYESWDRFMIPRKNLYHSHRIPTFVFTQISLPVQYECNSVDFQPYRRVINHNVLVIEADLTILDAGRTCLYLPDHIFCWFVSYEFFDRKFIYRDHDVLIQDRYNIVMFPDQFRTSDKLIYYNRLCHDVDALQLTHNCEIHWYEERRQLHFAFILNPQSIPISLSTQSVIRECMLV